MSDEPRAATDTHFRFSLAPLEKRNYSTTFPMAQPTGQLVVHVEYSRPLTADELELLGNLLTAAQEFAKKVRA